MMSVKLGGWTLNPAMIIGFRPVKIVGRPDSDIETTLLIAHCASSIMAVAMPVSEVEIALAQVGWPAITADE